MNRREYCDSCLDAAYDAIGYDEDKPDAQEEFLDMVSGEGLLVDHLCDRIESDGDIPCKCGDHKGGS